MTPLDHDTPEKKTDNIIILSWVMVFITFGAFSWGIVWLVSTSLHIPLTIRQHIMVTLLINLFWTWRVTWKTWKQLEQ